MFLMSRHVTRAREPWYSELVHCNRGTRIKLHVQHLKSAPSSHSFEVWDLWRPNTLTNFSCLAATATYVLNAVKPSLY